LKAIGSVGSEKRGPNAKLSLHRPPGTLNGGIKGRTQVHFFSGNEEEKKRTESSRGKKKPIFHKKTVSFISGTLGGGAKKGGTASRSKILTKEKKGKREETQTNILNNFTDVRQQTKKVVFPRRTEGKKERDKEGGGKQGKGE